MSCIAATTLTDPASTSPDMTGLRSSSVRAASLALVSATACTSAWFFELCSPGTPVVASTAGRMLARVAELDVVDGALDGAAIGVAEDHDQLGLDDLGRVLQAADDVGI